MDTKDALKHFDNSPTKLARAIGIKPHSIYDWGVKPPYLRQCQIEKVTKRKLRAEMPELPR
jgi:hypothetical protein